MKGSFKMGKLFATVVAGLSLTSLWAGVEDLTYRQRWPWGPQVDIDFAITGDAPIDIELTATYDGCPNPIRLDGEALTGSLFSLEKGDHHLVWDPTKAGLGNVTLRNFKIAVTAGTTEEHRYLVINLSDGSYEYLSVPPADGWTDVYRQTKMAFRRIPAGTYSNGANWSGVVSPLNAYQGYWKERGPHTSMGERTVELTSDYYMAIFPVTGKQYETITGTTLPSGQTWLRLFPYHMSSYNAWRGSSPDVDWPTTKYEVAEDSILAKLRAKFSNAFLFDLPTETQWEVAARAGTTTIYPNGGADAIAGGVVHGEVFTNLVSEIGWCGITVGKEPGMTKTGSFAANGWGLYDVVGNGLEWTLDQASAAVPAGTNPVGPVAADSGLSGRRILRSCSDSETLFGRTLPAYRQWDGWPSVDGTATIRLCIHLKSLFE